ncbi:MAG: polyphosphate kinase 1 [Kordia sp.]|nr:MAG: polyphosphate kinase 1 [Kordia sp.]
MTNQKDRYINRELSWLQFNARVLQEAADSSVPLLERLRFIGIFSNNLDEFFKVRYATVKRISEAGKSGRKALGVYRADELLELITKEVIIQQSKSLAILEDVYAKLEEENIYVLKEDEITHPVHKEFITDFYIEKVSPALMAIVLNDNTPIPRLKDSAAYLAVKMKLSDSENQYALLEIPRSVYRFVVLPKVDDKDCIIILDNLIRYSLDAIFDIFNYQSIEAHMIKITLDAELDIESDLGISFLEKLSKSVKKRVDGVPVRFIYDKTIASDTLAFLMSKMGIEANDSVIPGGRYHFRRDYMDFPDMGRKDLLYAKEKPLAINGVSLNDNLFKKVADKDFLQYTPYHSFSYIIKFLREAALDPKVKTIKITIYRLAKISHIISSLINAAKNGKEVTVQIELQARFDEASNMEYAQNMQDEGIKLIFGVKGLKVHSKVCLVERLEGKKIKLYGFISTGNFNNITAKVYTDYTLFTANQDILKDLRKVFNFLKTNYIVNKYKHLLVSPHYAKNGFMMLIDTETQKALEGKPAQIKLKLNSITSYKMVDKLYDASNAGVQIKMIVRGICCLIPGIKGLSENIEAISIVDKYLEHPRMMIFGIEGEEKVYISSSDWMTRNLDNRVEVTCPIYDEDIKKELIDTFSICWSDNVKARILSKNQDNAYREITAKPVRSQAKTYEYYVNKITVVK